MLPKSSSETSEVMYCLRGVDEALGTEARGLVSAP
jgi:hypothetical protein